MAKRYFCVQVGGYINELKIASVGREFLEYWKDKDDSDLLDAIDGNGVEVSEEAIPRFSSWNEADDVCSIYSIDEDSDYEVYEIKPHPDTEYVDEDLRWRKGKSVPRDDDNPFRDLRFDIIGNSSIFNSNDIGCESEMYWTDVDDIDEGVEYTDTPIVVFHAVDKGSLGTIFIELEDEDFDSKKFQHSYIETNIGMFASQWWYDRKPLHCVADGDTYGKSFDVSFGYVRLPQITYDYAYEDDGSECKHLKEAFDE